MGLPIPDTTIRIVDPETYQDVPDGTQGLVLVKVRDGGAMCLLCMPLACFHYDNALLHCICFCIGGTRGVACS